MAAKKKTAPVPAAPAQPTSTAALTPPPGGAVIRMYRIGHGDCFLIAFDGKQAGKPSYVLIDCGYKPGSPRKIDRTPAMGADEVAEDILKVTGGFVDIVVVTHEHQDHVNGFTKGHFGKLKVGTVWFAWTEDPQDPVANALRAKFKDQLLGLLGARNRLAAAGAEGVDWLDDFLAFELGGEEETFNPATAAGLLGATEGGGGSANKNSMKLLRTLAGGKVRYLRPHQPPVAVPGAANARTFVLGPPAREEEILDVDPKGGEEFHLLSASASADHLGEAFGKKASGPFAMSRGIPLGSAAKDPACGAFFSRVYGEGPAPKGESPRNGTEVADGAPWRRIDDDWLHSAFQLAIERNNATNNTSLVLAFELGRGGKVLLFAADAQRGNWKSWTAKSWKDGARTVTARDLLGRTVLYKVGHHGSHNATLNGREADPYANLSWMGQGDAAGEFTAMITAVEDWAATQKGWDHPQPGIKKALLTKCAGRVLQTDTELSDLDVGGDADFLGRTTATPLYFDHVIRG